ncbi:3-oxoacyl-ACP synthase 3 [Candidatus Trichorickettsia mobilis]|uniref:Beta-ketoacyl-[acyl-carrier-protein] synthase III n=1 Tax=Candidatus Trichorickettsia mobilis TaxID=1346319 RepID=A0ABZ0USB9_9RICK|nr:beta-ketoacyl-ACP synthase III [Candidatus Trichorickettsia mobilis]WPY00917.1 3-oxoacyl-ACP synthase 3 [Candidatus Trichorickettsia mobilis]
MTCKIIGCGGYLPKKIVSNLDLESFVDTTDEWIKSRTGILQRHLAASDEYTSHLAFKAAEHALQDANLLPTDIDLIIVCTTTPDNSFPSTATKVQGYFALKNTPSFDLQAVCSGFIYGLQIADSLVASGKYNTILLICAEKMSSLLDWSDRSTCVLFGDGAGAVVLQRKSASDNRSLVVSPGTEMNSGIIDSQIYSDGSYGDLLYTDGGVSSNGQSGKIKMKGPALFKNAVEKMTDSVIEILVKNNLTIDDISYFIPHQANIRIIQSIVERLNINENKVIKTIAKHANCSASSIPLALSELKSSEALNEGDIILFTAFGAGLTWGSALYTW